MTLAPGRPYHSSKTSVPRVIFITLIAYNSYMQVFSPLAVLSSPLEMNYKSEWLGLITSPSDQDLHVTLDSRKSNNVIQLSVNWHHQHCESATENLVMWPCADKVSAYWIFASNIPVTNKRFWTLRVCLSGIIDLLCYTSKCLCHDRKTAVSFCKCTAYCREYHSHHSHLNCVITSTCYAATTNGRQR